MIRFSFRFHRIVCTTLLAAAFVIALSSVVNAQDPAAIGDVNEGRAAMSTAPASTPIVNVIDAWFDWDEVHVQLAVWNVASLESFGFGVDTSPATTFIEVISLHPEAVVTHDPTYWRVAGYFPAPVNATSSVALIEVVLKKQYDFVSWIKFYDFVDDLEGVGEVMVDGFTLPVLFSSFLATPVVGGVEINWELESDEAMNRFTLYRREGTDTQARAIAGGAVASATGSYLDRAPRPGTYHYELLITTEGGDEFRSPVATATVKPLVLALHQNVPNPFNPQTTIRYDVPAERNAVRVRLWVADVSGRVVRTLVDEDQTGGTRDVVWRGTDDRGEAVSSGVYFSILDVGGERRTRKLVLLK